MSMSQTDKAAATARRIENARHAKALAMAEVAEVLCRRTEATADDLFGYSADEWRMLSLAAGRTNVEPSETTKAMVVDMVRDRLTARPIARRRSFSASLMVD